MGRLIDTLLRRLARAGVRRALPGDHWAWLVLAGSAYVARRARRRADVVTKLSLTPGERYLVSVQPSSRRAGSVKRSDE